MQHVTESRRHFRPRWILLVPPYLGLCFPALYSRSEPPILGFPFFYWYQFAWVVLTSLLLFIYYRLVSRAN